MGGQGGWSCWSLGGGAILSGGEGLDPRLTEHSGLGTIVTTVTTQGLPGKEVPWLWAPVTSTWLLVAGCILMSPPRPIGLPSLCVQGRSAGPVQPMVQLVQDKPEGQQPRCVALLSVPEY